MLRGGASLRPPHSAPSPPCLTNLENTPTADLSSCKSRPFRQNSCEISSRPAAFISSTEQDLKDHRDQAALANGLFPEMMKYFPARGQPVLPACLEKVAELVIIIVAHRHGWVPTNPDAKSITWLECNHAWNAPQRKVRAFIVDPDYEDWPLDQRENYRAITDRRPRGIHEEVERNERASTTTAGSTHPSARCVAPRSPTSPLPGKSSPG
jgi:uncharacterized protein DUF4062